jgi:peptidoglycan-N-acetylglucosamine deacetylase
VGRLGTMARKAAAALSPGYFFRRAMAAPQAIGPYCTISFDCDFPRDIAVLPELVALLRQYEVPASFACIGRWVREFPAEHQSIVDAGFELLNHTENHPNLYHPQYDYARAEGLSREVFNRIGPERRREEILRGHETMLEVLGVEAVGFRTPHFGALHVDDVYAPLVELNYRFSSSVMAAERGPGPYRPLKGLWEIPVSPCPLHPCGVFDSWHSLSKTNASHRAPGELANLFSILIDTAVETGGLANVYFDPRDVLESGELLCMLQVLRDSAITAVDYGQYLDALSVSSAAADAQSEVGVVA